MSVKHAWLLQAKAEVVIGAHLVLRHRTPRLAALLVVSILVLHSVQRIGFSEVPRQTGTLLLLSGTLSAVACSRLLAPGAALGSAYRVAATWWMVPVGRLLGALVVILPVVAVAAVVLAFPRSLEGGVFRVGLASLSFAAATGAMVQASAPVLGASAAAALGFLTVWLGSVPPSTVAVLTDWSPPLGWIVALLWHAMPAGWRANRWLGEGALEDGLVLWIWVVAGVVGAAWVIGVFHRARHPGGGGVT